MGGDRSQATGRRASRRPPGTSRWPNEAHRCSARCGADVLRLSGRLRRQPLHQLLPSGQVWSQNQHVTSAGRKATNRRPGCGRRSTPQPTTRTTVAMRRPPSCRNPIRGQLDRLHRRHSHDVGDRLHRSATSRTTSRCGCGRRATRSTGEPCAGASSTTSPPTGCYDAEMIALHEFGHVQTLDHPDDADVTTGRTRSCIGRPRPRQRPAGTSTSSVAATLPGCRSATSH